jgi:hypothetical protein
MHFDEYAGRMFGSNGTSSGGSSDRYQPPADKKNFGINIEIDEEVYDKIMHWVDKSNFEVSGLGMIEHDPESNTLRVTDAILLPQKNTQVSTEIDGAAVAKAMFLMKDKPGTLRWWWHSHVDMGVFWSGTDVETIKQLGSGGWFVATVFNKKREMKSAYCQVAPVPLIVDDLPTEVMEYFDADLVKKWDADYDKNVTNENLADKVSEAVASWGGRRVVHAAPEVEDLFPCEVDDDDIAKEIEEKFPGISEEELFSHFTLNDLYEMKREGEISEKIWNKAINTAEDHELDRFFKCQNLEEDLSALDISTRSTSRDDDTALD